MSDTSLPPAFEKSRILNCQQAAALANFSVPHWRRLYRAKKVPAPIKLGERKLGWRASELLNWLAERPRD
jgi:predicted DNA-binding transcriptional regulator AlpA